jgi:S-formylglutathione hydrolase
MLERFLAPGLLEIVHPSAALGRDRKRCLIVGPPEALDAGEPRPVSYLLHSWGGNARSWVDHPRVFALLKAAPHYTVMPESFRRWFINDHEGWRYEDYLIDELVPLIDARLGLAETPVARAIGGFSMGGCAAFLAAVRHPGMFGAVFCHASAFDAPGREGDPYALLRGPGRRLLMPTEAEHEAVWGPVGSAVRHEYDPYLAVRRSPPHQLRIYLDIGLGDYPRMKQMVRSFNRFLLAQGLSPEYRESEGGHDLDFIAAMLPHSLDFLARAFETVPAGAGHDGVPRGGGAMTEPLLEGEPCRI